MRRFGKASREVRCPTPQCTGIMTEVYIRVASTVSAFETATTKSGDSKVPTISVATGETGEDNS